MHSRRDFLSANTTYACYAFSFNERNDVIFSSFCHKMQANLFEQDPSPRSILCLAIWLVNDVADPQSPD